jgi:hypothetical protein
MQRVGREVPVLAALTLTVASCGAGSVGTGSGSGDAGSGNQFCTPITMIDDMEDGDGAVCPNSGRQGGWYTVKGTAGTISPLPNTVVSATLIPGGRSASRYAIQTSGSGFVTTAPNDNWAVLGASVNDQQAYDASGHVGLRFWAQSPGGAFKQRVNLTTTASRSGDNGGTCVAQASTQCNDHWGLWVDFTTEWVQYTVNFDFVTQSGWGVVAPKDLAHLWTIEFNYVPTPTGSSTANPTSFDYWIDDLEFW